MRLKKFNEFCLVQLGIIRTTELLTERVMHLMDLIMNDLLVHIFFQVTNVQIIIYEVTFTFQKLHL